MEGLSPYPADLLSGNILTYLVNQLVSITRCYGDHDP